MFNTLSHALCKKFKKTFCKIEFSKCSQLVEVFILPLPYIFVKIKYIIWI
ncbi:hypothetical protein Hanom_Chr13g01235161 [Helianthus anomalus]